MAGAAAFLLIGGLMGESEAWMSFLGNTLLITLFVNLLVIVFELSTPHPTADAKKAVKLITRGPYKNSFWGLVILMGNLIPVGLLLAGSAMAIPAALLVLAGIYISEHIWVQAPQQIPLS